ncbi:hypothetical protein LBMAG56_35550 [Verrucomicrobiota bacterium]|nr:hypothetical protein LBMAG56_35550 [Verrucomicrobiota bacterium]
MNATLTIRLGKQQRAALSKRARELQKTESEVARELLAAGLEHASAWEDISDLLGSVKLPKETTDPWRKKLRERNWRK